MNTSTQQTPSGIVQNSHLHVLLFVETLITVIFQIISICLMSRVLLHHFWPSNKFETRNISQSKHLKHQLTSQCIALIFYFGRNCVDNRMVPSHFAGLHDRVAPRFGKRNVLSQLEKILNKRKFSKFIEKTEKHSPLNFEPSPRKSFLSQLTRPS
ncbi:hypothetical protein DdX_19098 [Ditylenchus destructor]|uniref:Uncharacterized protein n=1 Tax=Ditylenchus destructor TaxID=166010 RepID=A0AAD4MKB8_9BILA|nr:hypothetical protein DdX_19098 [Ditylenchus destructor]